MAGLVLDGKMFLGVKNWARFQHYKAGDRADKTPPWIKLYFDLLTNHEFCELPDASKWHLVSIWLLASRRRGVVPYDQKWIQEKVSAQAPIDLISLINGCFLYVCDECGTLLATDASTTRGEKRREDKNPQPPEGADAAETQDPQTPNIDPAAETRQSSLESDDGPPGFLRFWSEWPKSERKKGKAQCLRIWRRKALEKIAEQVIQSVRQHKTCRAWLKNGGEFIPGPLPWLNQGGWEAPVVPAAPEGAKPDEHGFVRAEVTQDVLDVAYGPERSRG